MNIFIVNVVDPTGAGDTAFSVASLALHVGFPPIEAAKLANLAASSVVQKERVVPLDIDVLLKEIKQNRKHFSLGPWLNGRALGS